MVTIGLNEELAPYYNISYRGAPVVLDSTLGFELERMPALSRGWEWQAEERRSRDETYTMVYGTRDKIRDHYHECTVSVVEKSAPRRKMRLVFRAYDEGVAFRYELPRQEELREFSIAQENTRFRFAANHPAYAMNLGKFTSPHESEFKRITLADIRPGSVCGMPALIEIPERTWVALTEANLANYAGMYLTGVEGAPHTLASSLSPLPDPDPLPAEPGSRRRTIEPNPSNPKVRASTPLLTPWRVVMIGATPGELIENNYLVLNLNEPCAIRDPSWIKPGRAAWNWWSGSIVKDAGFEGGMNTATMKYYIDFAADHNLEYMLIDARWSPVDDITRSVPEINIPEIVAHASRRGVRVLLWAHWSAVDRQMDVAFPLYRKWGIAGVKVDSMNRDDQQMVDFCQRVVRRAAENRLLVNFHGTYKPDGIQRTWPNLVTREAVLGLEYDKFSDRATPEHDATIPFTRMLAGPMDYTPGAFRTVFKKDFKATRTEPVALGTRCHQLALLVVLESPLLVLADHPAAYRGQPGIEFVKQVPTTWNETRVIQGQVADYITIARRHGRDWYVGTLTDWDPRELKIPLSFLGEGKYMAEIYSDAPPADRLPTHVSIEKKIVTAADTILARMGPGGGHVMRLAPAPDGVARRRQSR
ncbi:MAG: glycoside hydrolase family 97 protein [Acidobacteria bacterium]|nr:glycoside hydrolase family 97 protein [Acidobacteriota bacterium]